MTEKAEGRSGLPSWQVRGKTFLRMGTGRTVATFRLPKESATILAAAHPAYAPAVHRRDADRTYLGLEVRLRGASGARLSRWVLEAWAATAPRSVVRRFLARGGPLPRRPRPRADRLREPGRCGDWPRMGPRRTPRSIARRGLRSLRGKTIRWELTDGAGGKSVYHHTFHADGSIVYRGAEASGTGRRIRPNRSFYGRLSETIFAVSYLNPPYTLTAFLDASTGRVRGVVSSDTMWTQFSGTWTLA